VKHSALRQVGHHLTGHVQRSFNDNTMSGTNEGLIKSRTEKISNEWIQGKAELQWDSLEAVKRQKLSNSGHSIHDLIPCLKEDIIQGTLECHHTGCTGGSSSGF